MKSAPLLKAQLLAAFIAAIAMQSADSALAAETPVNPVQLEKRMAELRRQYAPFLEVRPAPAPQRRRQDLSGADWVSRFEVRRVSDQPQTSMAPRPVSPGWEHAPIGDPQWERTTVPEWRYDNLATKEPASCILWYRKDFAAKKPAAGERVFLVFEGVDWEAEVWLNGKKLGSHSVYFEPFRFDVTDIISATNTLAVRVIDGPQFGEPAAYWAVFPVPPAADQRYVRDRNRSLAGLRNGDTHIGSGYGIHRDVYLETTRSDMITDVAVRGYPERGKAVVQVGTSSSTTKPERIKVELLPENFVGKSYAATTTFGGPQRDLAQKLTVSAPDARQWSPDAPWLYRCRVSLLDAEGSSIDVRDVLFGFRSLEMVSELNPRAGYPPGALLLDGVPLFLRGANIQGLNALWFWGEHEKLLDVLLLLKAGNFNSIRACQHVLFPEVRELLDRLGLMSQQDVGCRYPRTGEQTRAELVHAAGVIAKACFNNPGVVLLTFANETEFDPTEMLTAAMAVDPERIFVPISGRRVGESLHYVDAKDAWDSVLPPELRAHVLDSFHPYWGWYLERARPWQWCRVLESGRMLQAGEYGAEALDGYETMKHYPEDWPALPSKESDTLWGQVQVEKDDDRQLIGARGQKPVNLGQYITASQNYQYDLLSEITKTLRISPRRVAAYFQFHFIDVLPANWPKSIVSHDLHPKRAYFAMAQCNQPLVPLPRLVRKGRGMEIWVANDLPRAYPGARVVWSVLLGDKVLLAGTQDVDVPAANAVRAGLADLAALPEAAEVVELHLALYGQDGGRLGSYTQEIYLSAWKNSGE